MITLLIPTLNRSDYVIRYLYYLQKNDFKGCVYIGDSSDNWHLDRTKRAIKELKADFSIIHREYPGLKIFECIRKMLPLISTPYSMYINDDDLLIPKTLEQGVQFLNNHPDYSAASGHIIHCLLRSKEVSDEIIYTTQGILHPPEAESASQRLLNLFSNYNVIIFSIYRTEQIKAMWPSIQDLSDISLATELLPCAMLAVQGKVKKFDRIFAVRQIHNRRYLMPDLYDWITSPNWLPSLEASKEYLAKALVEKDRISLNTAYKIIKQAFWSYLCKGLQHKFQSRYGKNNLQTRMKRTLKKIPIINDYLLPSLRSIKSKISNSAEMALPALLDAKSPYHADFMPVYRAVTDSLEKIKE